MSTNRRPKDRYAVKIASTIPKSRYYDGVRSIAAIDLDGDMGLRGAAQDNGRRRVNIAWKYLWTAKDTWLGATANLGSIGALFNLTMDPFEKYDMIFNGAAPARVLTTSPGKYSGEDNG